MEAGAAVDIAAGGGVMVVVEMAGVTGGGAGCR
jgi:hypothetical protein